MMTDEEGLHLQQYAALKTENNVVHKTGCVVYQ